MEGDKNNNLNNDSFINADSDSSPTAVSSFAAILTGYKSLLAKVDAFGFTTPTPVQRMAIPEVLRKEDTIVQASTGSGKTLVYLIGMLARIHRENPPHDVPFSLVLVPTRELAVQICEVLCNLDPDVSPVCVIGGDDIHGQTQKLREDARIVVGTPGRIRDIMRRSLDLRSCKYFVLDEADEMLSIGFLDDVRAILSRLPDVRQGVFISATITPRVEMIASAFLTKPKIVSVALEDDQVPSIEHLYLNVGNELTAKPTALCDIIEAERPLSAIIFCNTRSETKLVEIFLRGRGFDARRINSDLTQKQRGKIMQRIRNRDLQFLVATDVAARGIDLEHIELVVNYSIHDKPEVYVHRTGRTGRAGRSGRAISLVGAKDFGAFHFLKKTSDINFTEHKLPSAEEIAGARLAHLYEIIRKENITTSERDILLARKLIAELGLSGNPEDQEAFIAKLVKYTIEHMLTTETGSLEDEIVDEDASSERTTHGAGQDDSSLRQSRKSQQAQRQTHAESRGRHGERHGERYGERRNDKRDNREVRGERKSQGIPEHFSPDATERENMDRSDGTLRDFSEDKAAAFPSHHNEESITYNDRHSSRMSHDEVSITISQGIAQGLTEEEFRRLAADFSEISDKDIRRVVMGSSNGFANIKAQSADTLIENLDGIEYNGETLNIMLTTPSNTSGRVRSRRRNPENTGRHDDRGYGRRNSRRRDEHSRS